ncbi:histone H2A, sperm [Triticum aestivum]|uniref:histone H2A, sperm n=1 Tax=Triticum aestivum TaxID=4565 RepID=UPI001D026AB1|nr:histone H2A, sperm-like [Triticum aestivum]
MEEGEVVRKRMSLSFKAWLRFPVSRVGRYLKQGRYARRVAPQAAVYLTAVLEYLVAGAVAGKSGRSARAFGLGPSLRRLGASQARPVLELSGNAAKANKKKLITPRHLMLAIRNDGELSSLLAGVTIAHGGVVPNINPALLPKRTAARKADMESNWSNNNKAAAPNSLSPKKAAAGETISAAEETTTAAAEE